MELITKLKRKGGCVTAIGCFLFAILIAVVIIYLVLELFAFLLGLL